MDVLIGTGCVIIIATLPKIFIFIAEKMSEKQPKKQIKRVAVRKEINNDVASDLNEEDITTNLTRKKNKNQWKKKFIEKRKIKLSKEKIFTNIEKLIINNKEISDEILKKEVKILLSDDADKLTRFYEKDFVGRINIYYDESKYKMMIDRNENSEMNQIVVFYENNDNNIMYYYNRNEEGLFNFSYFAANGEIISVTTANCLDEKYSNIINSFDFISFDFLIFCTLIGNTNLEEIIQKNNENIEESDNVNIEKIKKQKKLKDQLLSKNINDVIMGKFPKEKNQYIDLLSQKRNFNKDHYNNQFLFNKGLKENPLIIYTKFGYPVIIWDKKIQKVFFDYNGNISHHRVTIYCKNRNFIDERQYYDNILISHKYFSKNKKIYKKKSYYLNGNLQSIYEMGRDGIKPIGNVQIYNKDENLIIQGKYRKGKLLKPLKIYEKNFGVEIKKCVKTFSSSLYNPKQLILDIIKIQEQIEKELHYSEKYLFDFYMENFNKVFYDFDREIYLDENKVLIQKYSTGELKTNIKIRNGIDNIIYEGYYKNGLLMFSGFINLKFFEIEIKFYDKLGVIVKKETESVKNKIVKKYYDNGILKSKKVSFNGNGTRFELYYDNGNTMAIFEKNDFYFVGDVSLYYKSEDIMAYCNFSINKPLMINIYDRNANIMKSVSINEILKRDYIDNEINDLMHIEFIFPYLTYEMIIEVFDLKNKEEAI
ncbi:hypothetical protein [Fusobacterium sp. PH5-44]|uniref:hypothetical protein n=1 Tax=unclassified Fusobacterium TaxID=2648384 RepID=UPI003D1C152C